MVEIARPIINIEEFEDAMHHAKLEDIEKEIIDYIRFIGTFNQPILTNSLKLPTKPPVLSVICKICRKIGNQMPNHFIKVREWSKLKSIDEVPWDGDLICSITFNIDGQRLSPEVGTAPFHNFAVHPELFQGLN